MSRWLMILILISSPTISNTETDNINVVIYPFQHIKDDYPLELLKLAMNKSNSEQNYLLQEAPVEISQGRSLILLSKNKEIDISWSLTSKERERILTAIKIPIYKGLFGYRIFVIRQNQQGQFPRSITAQRLANERVAIQGVDWPDFKILKHNKFNVMSVKRFDAMFELVQKGRADYFPRSIIEIWYEESHFNFNKNGLKIDQNLAFFYPSHMFFFVSKSNQKLANIIRNGLQISIQDGSFDKLFNTHKGAVIKNAKLSQRTVFTLDNPTVNNEGVYQWPSLITANDNH